MLKVVAVNSPYNANVYTVWRMAEDVCEVLADPARPDGPELVDRLAKIGKRERRSFASKFAHFFIDAEAYPMLDQYVVKMLSYHLGSRRVWPRSLVEFCPWCEERFATKGVD